jgi:hypothetical protein
MEKNPGGNQALKHAQCEEQTIPHGADHEVDLGAVLPPVLGLDLVPDLGTGPGHASPSDRMGDLVSGHVEISMPRLAMTPTTRVGAPMIESGQVSQPQEGIQDMATHQDPASAQALDSAGSLGSSVASGSSTPVLAQRRTRAQHGISKPRVYTDGMIRYASLATLSEPMTVSEALDSKEWK